MSTVARAAPPLSPRQLAIVAASGAVLWLAAALLLRWINAQDGFSGGGRLLIYAVLVPGTLPFVYLLRWLGRLEPAQLLPGVAITTTTALLLDGIATAWFPALYGASPQQVLDAAAAILWGAGVGMVLAAVMARNP